MNTLSLRNIKSTLLPGILFVFVLQDLPPGPTDALNTLAAWLLELLMALLAVYFAIYAFKTGRKTQDAVARDHEESIPIVESIKKFGRWLLVLAILVSTFLLPSLIFGKQGPILSFLAFVLDWILNAIGFPG